MPRLGKSFASYERKKGASRLRQSPVPARRTAASKRPLHTGGVQAGNVLMNLLEIHWIFNAFMHRNISL